MKFGGLSALAAIVAGIAMAGWQVLPALAQPSPAATPAPSTTPPAAPPLSTAPSTVPTLANPTPAPLQQPVTADVPGFRSARFGMTQDQVREAIKADFSIEGKDVHTGANDQEKTKFLAVQFANLVPDSGIATITYIFGFSSQKLIQVNVLWAKTQNQEFKPTELVTTGRLLQQYFVGQGFARDTMLVNRTTNTGSIILFNGFDDHKRSVLLVLETVAVPVKTPPGKPDAKAPPKPADKAGDKKPPQMQLVASALRLSYIENATSPDVFRIQRGKF